MSSGKWPAKQSSERVWLPDTLLDGFETTKLVFPPDYDGPVEATLVRSKAGAPSRRAFLYIHGFIDYFFQAHFAEQCNLHGYDFYALDLRKYGRSLGASKHPNFCRDIREYYPEITEAIRIITEQAGHDILVLDGHSTGGLICALYASEGPARKKIDALVLNSPFFDFNLPAPMKAVSGLLAGVGKVAPFGTLKGGVSQLYPMSIHRDYYGEWDFDLHLKPVKGFPVYLGWVRAIQRAQARVRRGLTIGCPVLVLHSDKSVYGKEWGEAFHNGDAVLSVDDIREGSRRLGPNVTDVEIKKALHDVTLSAEDVRNQAFAELFSWLDRSLGGTGSTSSR